MIRRTAGPIATTKNEGNRQSTSGKISLVPIFAASSSAFCMRLSRNSSEYTAQRIRDAGAESQGLDQKADETANIVQSGAFGQIPQRHLALDTRSRLRIHQSELGRELRMTEAQLIRDALDRRRQPSPASTQTTSMSSASGKPFRSRFWRASTIRPNTMFGPIMPIAAASIA